MFESRGSGFADRDIVRLAHTRHCCIRELKTRAWLSCFVTLGSSLPVIRLIREYHRVVRRSIKSRAGHGSFRVDSIAKSRVYTRDNDLSICFTEIQRMSPSLAP